jgi:hypothetical protein
MVSIPGQRLDLDRYTKRHGCEGFKNYRWLKWTSHVTFAGMKCSTSTLIYVLQLDLAP